MVRLQPTLKDVKHFLLHSILVVLCRAVAIPEPRGKAPPEKILPKSNQFCLKNMLGDAAAYVAQLTMQLHN